MKTRAVKNREELKNIQYEYMKGNIDRNTAKQRAQPILKKINSDIIQTTEMLNRKYGLSRKPPILNFTAAMRNQY